MYKRTMTTSETYDMTHPTHHLFRCLIYHKVTEKEHSFFSMDADEGASCGVGVLWSWHNWCKMPEICYDK